VESKRKIADVTPGSTASPLPQVEVNSTPAPGLRGPKGLSPRQNYSRVNSGAPPQPDAGSAGQKSMPPMGATMLPAKVASEGSMGTMSATPTLQDMVKAAMAGARERVRLSQEAAVQQANFGEKTAGEKCSGCGKEKDACTCKDKGASAGSISTEYAEKLAAAMEYAAPFVKSAAHMGGSYTLKAETQEVGKGSGALHVMEAEASKPLPDHKGQGHHTVPTSTPLQAAVAGAKTQLENNAHHHTPGEMIQRNVGKTAAVLAKLAKEDEKLEKQEGKGLEEAAKGLAKAEEAHAKEAAGKKDNDRNLSTGESAAALLLGGPGGYFGAKKAREHGHSALAGGVLGNAGSAIGSQLGGRGAVELAHALGAQRPEVLVPLGLAGALAGGYGGYKALTHPMGQEATQEKEASLADVLLGITKKAEDAINPAQISAGAAVPPDTSAAGESGGAPAGGMPQGPTSLVGSNESSMNYNKNEAKAPVKTDMKKYFNEPALSGSTDTTLRAAFEHSSAKDNNKMASVQGATKTAAARALLSKLAEAAQAKVSG